MLISLKERKISRESGYGMIEVLVTILILAFGLLALGGLQARLQTAEMESYQRSQAILMLEDMASRITINKANVAQYVGLDTIGTDDAQPVDCSGEAIGALRDVCEWSNSLKGAGEVSSGGANVGAMIGARGCIEQISADPVTLRVSVSWQGLAALGTSPLTCGAGQYGDDDAMRRTISVIFSVWN